MLLASERPRLVPSLQVVKNGLKILAMLPRKFLNWLGSHLLTREFYCLLDGGI